MLQISLMLIIAISASCNNYTITRQRKSNYSYLSPQLRHYMAKADNNNQIIGLGNQGLNDEYFITMEIGTPPQELNLQLDTGSNIMWVALPSVGIHQFFDPALSSTYSNTGVNGSILYNDGGVYGNYGSEVIGVKNTTINVTQGILWTYSTKGLFIPLQIGGLVGMGYTTVNNFLDLAYQQGQIATSAFALSLRSVQSNESSYLYYNQIPEQITSNSVYLPVVQGGFYWQIQTIGIRVGGIDMSDLVPNLTVFDSGTSYFYLYTDLYNQIRNQFFLNCINGEYGPICLCSQTSSWPSFQFILNGLAVYIHPEQYIGVLNSTYCTYNFGPTPIYEILLGDIFFFKYNVSYSKLTNEIGFQGQFNYVDLVTPAGTNIAQYVLLGIMISLTTLGFIQLVLLYNFQAESSSQQNSQVKNRRASDVEISRLITNKLSQPLVSQNNN